MFFNPASHPQEKGRWRMDKRFRPKIRVLDDIYVFNDFRGRDQGPISGTEMEKLQEERRKHLVCKDHGMMVWHDHPRYPWLSCKVCGRIVELKNCLRCGGSLKKVSRLSFDAVDVEDLHQFECKSCGAILDKQIVQNLAVQQSDINRAMKKLNSNGTRKHAFRGRKK